MVQKTICESKDEKFLFLEEQGKPTTVCNFCDEGMGIYEFLTPDIDFRMCWKCLQEFVMFCSAVKHAAIKMKIEKVGKGL